MPENKKELTITSVFKRNYESKYKINCNIGGARSSKSYSIAQLFAYKMRTERNKNIGITRKTLPALKMTAYRLFIDILKEWGLYNVEHHNRTENFYDFPEKNNRVQFFSLDDPEKIKSTEFNYIWLEEASEFTFRDYITLYTRLSGKTSLGELNQIFLSLNPEDANSWIATKLIKEPNCNLIKSNYLDNPFLGEDYVKILTDLKNQDENAYKIFTLGEWGNTEGLIYKNYNLVDEMPKGDFETFYGLDFGYNVPTALIEIKIKDKEVYIDELLYKTGLTNSDVIEELKKLNIDKHNEIFADCAEPARIEEICREGGFNAMPSDKSVKTGIDFVKKFRLHITKKSDNVIKEIKSYSWKKNKDGNFLDEPIKFNDHLLDALRYGLYTKLKDYISGDTGVFGGIEL